MRPAVGRGGRRGRRAPDRNNNGAPVAGPSAAQGDGGEWRYRGHAN